jgi:hypothetical protein
LFGAGEKIETEDARRGGQSYYWEKWRSHFCF